VFKLVITEVRNFPELADYWREMVVEPGQELIGRILARGVQRGEFRPVDLPAAVLSLIFPMVMLCVHKHSFGACVPVQTLDPHAFIDQHIDLVLGGLLAAPAPKRKRVP
jgi:hypothetical protein